MPNIALIPDAVTEIPPLVGIVDGYPEERHRLETVVGGEPLEDGRDVTDHAVARQARLELTGWVSDFNGGDRPRAAWETIRRLHKDLTTVVVQTEWGRYEEMIIRRAETHKQSRGLRFLLELHEILRVGVTDLDLPMGTTSGPAMARSGEVDRGRVQFV